MKNNSYENMNYQRKVNKNGIPICPILGVSISAINMEWLLGYLENNVRSPEGNRLAGNYCCVSNVHTTVMAYKDSNYRTVQNGGLLAIPDGSPLSIVGRRRGYKEMQRTTGPDLMGEIFRLSLKNGYRHFFYGSTPETLRNLELKLQKNYHGIVIAGMYSPPFRSEQENEVVIDMINKSKADFIWVGLGAPKQEIWMAKHQGMVDGLMIGVGAGFDYYAGNIQRAPKWMQKSNLEWFYRLIQEPKRLFYRYWHTNWKFIWHAYLKGR